MRKVAIVAYDSLLLIGVFFVTGLLFDFVTGYRALEMHGSLWRHGFQLYLLAVAAAYYIGFWRAGQTLAMQAWRVRLTTRSGAQLSWRQAAARFLLALVMWTLAGLAFWWSLFDRDGQLLHDRLLGTRLSRH